jgi:hypothetical protein
MCKCRTDEDHQNKILGRYLEFCNLERDHFERVNFSYNYRKNTMTIERENHATAIEFNIADFIDWDRISYPDNPCFSVILS